MYDWWIERYIMKKIRMKKVFSLLIAVILTIGLIGCGSGDSGSSDSSSSDGDSDVKIGVAIWSTTDALGTMCYEMLNSAADALDCEVQFETNGFDTDETISNVENLIASGCDAIIVCNSSDSIMPNIMNLCNDAGVYCAQFFRNIEDEAIKAVVEESEYFLGCTHEDEYSTGYNLGKALADNGYSNVALISWNHGDTTAEARYSGYIDAFNEFGVNLLAEQWEVNTAEDGTRTAENFINSYPELEAIVVTGGSGEPLQGTLTAIENMNKVGEISVVSTDFLEDMDKYFENGELAAMSGGHFCDPFFSFMLCYNVLQGGYSLDDMPVEIVDNMIFVSSLEDVQNYQEWFEGDVLPYTEEEIQELACTYNEDTTLEDLMNAAANLSLDDVMTRHGQ